MPGQLSTSPLPIIAVIGSLNADLTTYTSRIPRGGETLHASSFKVGSGGKGGNQACACAKLSRSSQDLQKESAKIKMIGAVGTDLYGGMLIDALKATGIDVSGITIKEEVDTGLAVILVEEYSGENRILLHAGANYALVPNDFQTLALPLPALVILQLEIPVLTTMQILRTARAQHVEVLLNPAPAVELPVEAYAGLSHLIMNETEAVILSGCRAEDIEHGSELRIVAETFHMRGVMNVIITLEAEGFSSQARKADLAWLRRKRSQLLTPQLLEIHLLELMH